MIDKFKFWCHKIIPLVYDDSLSYYEVLCKLTGKINEVIEYVQTDFGEGIVEAIKEIIKDLKLGYDANTETLNIDFDEGVPSESDDEIAYINASGVRRGVKDSEARSSINTLNTELLANLAQLGVFDTANRVIRVKSSGGGDYASLVDAVNSVVDGEGTIIYLYEGTYDVSSAGNLGLTLPDKCYIVGVGNRANIRIVCNLGAPNSYYSAINYTKNCGVCNVYIHSENTRYVIHDDSDVQGEHNTRVTLGCILEGYNLTYQYAYGAGIKGGGTAIIKDCVIISNNQKEAISFHNMTEAEDSSYIIIENNVLFGGKNVFGSTIRLAAVMNYNGSTVTKPVYVTAKQNTNANFTFDLEYGSGNPFILRCDGICKFRAINGQVIPWGEISNPDMLQKPYPYDPETLTAGSPVFFNDPMTVATLLSLPVSLVGGVALTSSPNVLTNIVVITKGYVPLTQIGLSGSAGQWINVVPDANDRFVLEVSSTRGNAIGYIDNTQQAYIDVSLR